MAPNAAGRIPRYARDMCQVLLERINFIKACRTDEYTFGLDWRKLVTVTSLAYWTEIPWPDKLEVLTSWHYPLDIKLPSLLLPPRHQPVQLGGSRKVAPILWKQQLLPKARKRLLLADCQFHAADSSSVAGSSLR